MTDTVEGSDSERIAKLEEQIAEQTKVLATLKAQLEPPKPFVRQPMPQWDPTANASMSLETWHEMAKAVGTGLVREVARDFRAGPALPQSQAEGPKSVGSGGFVEATPLGPQPGAKLIEEIADHFDRKDRAKGL